MPNLPINMGVQVIYFAYFAFTLFKISPMAHLTPLAPRGREFIFAYLAKKVLYLPPEHMMKVL